MTAKSIGVWNRFLEHSQAKLNIRTVSLDQLSISITNKVVKLYMLFIFDVVDKLEDEQTLNSRDMAPKYFPSLPKIVKNHRSRSIPSNFVPAPIMKSKSRVELNNSLITIF